jgi:hypothetical protein
VRRGSSGRGRGGRPTRAVRVPAEAEDGGRDGWRRQSHRPRDAGHAGRPRVGAHASCRRGRRPLRAPPTPGAGRAEDGHCVPGHRRTARSGAAENDRSRNGERTGDRPRDDGPATGDDHRWTGRPGGAHPADDQSADDHPRDDGPATADDHRWAGRPADDQSADDHPRDDDPAIRSGRHSAGPNRGLPHPEGDDPATAAGRPCAGRRQHADLMRREVRLDRPPPRRVSPAAQPRCGLPARAHDLSVTIRSCDRPDGDRTRARSRTGGAVPHPGQRILRRALRCCPGSRYRTHPGSVRSRGSARRAVRLGRVLVLS